MNGLELPLTTVVLAEMGIPDGVGIPVVDYATCVYTCPTCDNPLSTVACLPILNALSLYSLGNPNLNYHREGPTSSM
jgi:hypothetical protein